MEGVVFSIAHFWSPLEVFDGAFVVHMREKQLWWPILIILTSLLVSELSLIPNLNPFVIRAGGEDGFGYGAPLKNRDLALVIFQHDNRLLRHSNIPNLNLAGRIAGDCEEISINRIKLPHTQTVLTCLICMGEFFC